jgi:hypothetical protein
MECYDQENGIVGTSVRVFRFRKPAEIVQEGSLRELGEPETVSLSTPV